MVNKNANVQSVLLKYITFGMSGDCRRAKPAGKRPFDGGVKRGSGRQGVVAAPR